MKKMWFLLLTPLVLVLTFAGYLEAGVVGVPDHVPAATVIVPYFEVGINSAIDCNDTLPIVRNTGSSPVTVHYQVWDEFGNALPDLSGNFTIGPQATKTITIRYLILNASASSLSKMTDGAFYRGFMTFDVVTSSTSLTPKTAGYPFGSDNVLEGMVYYTRLCQGSSNGLPMISIEATPSTSMSGFFQASDNRERIDADARYSAEQGALMQAPNNAIGEVDARVFLDPNNNGTSKLIVFTFPQGGSCVNCGPGQVAYKHYDESGNLVEDTSVNLDRIVNVINVAGTQNGDISLRNIPGGWETFAFSTNSASPGFNPALTWDAIFEASVKVAAGGTISGMAVKGPVAGATVTAFAVSNGVMGGQIGTGQTDGQGNFSIPVGNYAGPVLLQMKGGSYTDEATGVAMSMQPGDMMTAVIPSASSGGTVSGIRMTPLTSMAQTMAQGMPGGMTPANIATANTSVGNYFVVNDILHVTPIDPLVTGSGNSADQNMRNYGMAMAAMSQYASGIGLQYSSAIVTAMMNDASDGLMNGMMGGSPVQMGSGGMMGGSMMSSSAGTSGLANAMTQFMNSQMNRSGLTVQDMQTLINKLMTSNGVIQ